MYNVSVTAIQLQNNKNKSHKEESNMKFVKKFRKSPVIKDDGMSIKSMYKEWDKQRAAVENMGSSARSEIDAIFTREIGKYETLNK